MTSTAAPLLRNVLLFGRALRRAGLPVSPGQSREFAAALEWIDLGRREQVFHAARALFVRRREDLALFADLFDRFWREPGGAAPPAPHPVARRAPSAAAVSAVPRRLPRAPEAETATDRTATASRREVLRRKEFAAMTDEELAVVRRLIAELRWSASRRRSRRLVADRRGSRLDLRRLLRDAAKHGGAVPRIARRGRKSKQRPVVLLADVSGSMERTSRLVLQLFYGLSHSLRRVESFVFGTRLTRVTAQLGLRDADRALAAAAREAADWAGGTRIGESLREFNRRWGRRVLGRGAVVLVISDGCERDEPALLAREIRRLARRCHRLIWLNPLLGTPGYRPLAGGMAAALPWVDDFLPIHDLVSLEALAARLAALPERRPLRSAPPAAETPTPDTAEGRPS